MLLGGDGVGDTTGGMTPPNNHHNNGHDVLDRWRRLAMFVVGATILILELEWHDSVRVYVIVLALILMGIVTFEQVREYLQTRATEVVPGPPPAKKPPD